MRSASCTGAPGADCVGAREAFIRSIVRHRLRSTEQALKLRLRPLRRALVLSRHEWRSAVPLPLLTRLRAAALGFRSQGWVLYQLDRHDPADYLGYGSAIDYLVRRPRRAAIGDKLGFGWSLAAQGAQCPGVVGFMVGGRLRPRSEASSQAPLAWLEEALEPGRQLVFRPYDWGMAAGLFFLRRDRDGSYQVNGEAFPRDDLGRLLGQLDDFVITEHVTQSALTARFFPATTNTLRVLTLWDQARAEPFIAGAVLRVGNARSAPVDNFHDGTGGFSVEIDLATGVLGLGRTLSPALDRLIETPVHPESGVRWQGVALPGWEPMCEEILRVAGGLPQFPYVGWDMIITDEGLCWLEGNSPPGPGVWQVHGGLLRDPRARAFFVHHGMIAG